MERPEMASMEVGSDNVFADLGLDDAPELKLKAAIVGQINAILRQRHLTQAAAADLLGVAQPKISALKHGKLHGFSLEKLLDFMVKLDNDVEIHFRKSSPSVDAGYFLKTSSGRVAVAADTAR